MRCSDWSSDVCSSDLRQHLLDAATPYLRGGEHDAANPAINRNTVPRFTHARTVDFTRRQCISAERWGDRDDLDVVIRSDPASGKPIAQHVIVADRKSTRLNSSH